MTNPIDGISGSNQVATEQANKIKETTGAGKTEREIDSTRSQAGSVTQADNNDQVVLTESAKNLQAIEKQLAAIPAVNSANIEAIRQQIADGKYQVKAASVAEKLIATDALLG